MSRDERGQSVVLAVMMLTALLGMAALVLDAGSWFRARRAVQQTSDAAALAGVQALPGDTATAQSLALTYAGKNGGGVASADITFESGVRSADTIVVTARQTAPGFFSKIFGLNSVNVSATAKARAYTLLEANDLTPFAVERGHPKLSGTNCPCFNTNTVIVQQGAGPGSFEIINLLNVLGGTSPGILADWITNGYDGYLPRGWYWNDPGAKFNPSKVADAMNARVNTTMLFPVYDAIRGNGANLEYKVIGFAGFYMTSWNAQGPAAEIRGYFQKVIWDGIQDETGVSPDFGAHSVSLIQ